MLPIQLSVGSGQWTAGSGQWSVDSFQSLLAAADVVPTFTSDAAITVAGLLAFLFALSLVIQIWKDLKPTPPNDEKYAGAEAFRICGTRCAADVARAEASCLDKIGALAKSVSDIQEDRKRNMADVWAAIRANEKTVSSITSDLQRALGRLEGRSDVMTELRSILGEKDKEAHRG